MSNEELDFANIEGDNNLIEENKKSRKMMEKLMETGKNQLTVISNLTERVKDLEEKLSRNKKLSKPQLIQWLNFFPPFFGKKLSC